MGCCTSKPCSSKWCGCCRCCKQNDNIAGPSPTAPVDGGQVSMEMSELPEMDEDSIEEEVRFGVLLPEPHPLAFRPPPPRDTHNNNCNNDNNTDRPDRLDRRPTTQTKSRGAIQNNDSLHASPPPNRESTSTQYQFFKMLDAKIESGPDYDANCERERKTELERLNALLHEWEACSRSSTQPGTPRTRLGVVPQTKQLVTAKQLNAALVKVSDSMRLQQQPAHGEVGEDVRGTPHSYNKTSAGVLPAGRYWPPLEMGISNYQDMYDFELHLQHQRHVPEVNQTATIIHQTYGVIGTNAPVPALLRTGLAGSNAPLPAMNNQLFQFSQRGGGPAAGPGTAREYHQEMYTGSHSTAPPPGTSSSPRQQFAIFDQIGIPPTKTRSAVIRSDQPQTIPRKNYDVYTYRQTPGTSAVTPPILPISAASQLKFSTLVSQGTPHPYQHNIQFYGNGELVNNKPQTKKVVQLKEAQVKRPSKQQQKHHRVAHGEVHQVPQVAQQIQDHQQRQLKNNGTGPSGCMPGSSGGEAAAARTFQTTVHIPIKAALNGERNRRTKEENDHIEMKKLN